MRHSRVPTAAAALFALALAFTPGVGRCQTGYTDSPHSLRRPAEESGSPARNLSFTWATFTRWLYGPRTFAFTRARSVVPASYARPVSGFVRRSAAR